MAQLKSIVVNTTKGNVTIQGYEYKGILLHVGIGKFDKYWTLTHGVSGCSIFNVETFALAKELGNLLANNFDFSLGVNEIPKQEIMLFIKQNGFDPYDTIKLNPLIK